MQHESSRHDASWRDIFAVQQWLYRQNCNIDENNNILYYQYHYNIIHENRYENKYNK